VVDEVRVLRLLRRITDDLAVGPPSDNGDAVNLLGKHGVLSPELASSLRKAVGFRNVLVHEYVEVSDDVVVTRLNDLSDIRAFVREVTTWIWREADTTPI
jgi:uncharacterized protein YutE (UPF0331/DUF86 family)